MKLHNGFDTRQLFRMLGTALNKEDALWSSVLYSLSDDKVTLYYSISPDNFCTFMVFVYILHFYVLA